MPEFTDAEKQLLKRVVDGRLRTSLAKIREAMEDIWAVDAPRVIQDFTDHGVKHSERLAGFALDLLKANNGKDFSTQEIYLLLAGIYLHDVGMQCDIVRFPEIKKRAEELGAQFDVKFTARTANSYSIEERKAIRTNHQYLTAAWIDCAYHTGETVLGPAAKTISEELVDDLMDVCKYHAKLSIADCPSKLDFDPNGRKQLVAALLRFADELDVDGHRVSIATVKNFRLSPDNGMYWWLHNRTSIRFWARNVILLLIRLNPEDVKRYGSLVHAAFIAEFQNKNQPVLGILKDNDIPVAISANSRVVEHSKAKPLPQEIVQALQEQKLGLVTPPTTGPVLPFTNRIDEIDQLVSSYAPAFHWVNAPARYGKTTLLRKVQICFEEKGWRCAYVSVQECRSLSLAAQRIADELNVPFKVESSSVIQDTNARELGQNLGGVIKSHWYTESQLGKLVPINGLVLLIDVDKSPWNSLKPTVYALLKGFLPGMEQVLRGFELFRGTHNPFRVILAGRYLHRWLEEAESPLEFRERHLTPFTYGAIRDAASAFLARRDTEQITAHLMHYTAGHPGCIARLLEMYKSLGEPPSHHFFSNFADEILERIVWPEAEDVRRNVEPTLLRYLDSLSVYRYLNEGVLRIWMSGPEHREFDRRFVDQFELADALVESELMAYEDHLLRDNISRRLLAIRLLEEDGSRRFAERCQRSQGVCHEYLQKASAQRPFLWAIEALFQFLQGHAGNVQDDRQRAQTRYIFLDETVPKVLNLLIANRNPTSQSRSLVRALKEDWEFQFTVNYFLRENQYSDGAYRSLEQRIESFFAEI